MSKVKGGSNKKGNNFGKSESKLGTNSVDSDGNIMRCHECDSTKHFASNCPHQKVEETNMTVHITLVTGKADSGTGSMLVEAHIQRLYQVRNGWMNILKI